jgi:hypothetical protein
VIDRLQGDVANLPASQGEAKKRLVQVMPDRDTWLPSHLVT